MIKKTLHLSAIVILLAVNNVGLSSCKEKKKTEVVTTPAPAPTEVVPDAPKAPVIISADDSLKQNVMDAIKDFPTVQASINDGVITVTGQIERPRLKTLMESLHGLHPKKIDNQLTIK